MKILIVTQHYWPETFRVTEIAEELVKRGHDITVLTGIPNYPVGEWFPGYSKKENRVQEHNGVKIIRAYEHPRGHNVIHRFWNYYSYPHNAKKMLKKMDHDFDVVYTVESSPIMMSSPAMTYKKKYGAKILMYEMDLWPHCLQAGGIGPSNPLYRHYTKTSKKIYSGMDAIFVSSKSHLPIVKSMVGENTEVTYLPQASEQIFVPKDHGYGAHSMFMFAGNIGVAQSPLTIVKAAEILKNEDISVTLVGDGIMLEECKKYAEEHGVNNVSFTGALPIADMPALYEKADCMLLTMKDSTYGNLTLPGKVQSYMASGKPIVGSANGEAKSIIEESGCGFCVNADDPAGLAESMLKFHRLSTEEKKTLGKNSLQYFLTNFKLDRYLDKIEHKLVDLSNKSAS